MKLRRFLLWLTAAVLLWAVFPARAETLQDCHRVTNTFQDTKQANKSVIRLWHVETALPQVTEEINAIAESWAAEIGPTLKKAANQSKSNSRVDVEIRYSRTGLSWMSFLVQARTTYHRALTGQLFTTRTYNMLTGERIRLADLFDAEEVWELLSAGVRSGLESYWPEEEKDPALLDSLSSRESLEDAEFTLHGMSLVIHFSASQLFPDRFFRYRHPRGYCSFFGNDRQSGRAGRISLIHGWIV